MLSSRQREFAVGKSVGLIDNPVQFLIALLVIAAAIRAMPKRRWRRSHRWPLAVRIAWVAGLLLIVLLALLAALDATPFASVDVCLDLWEGYEWCTHESEP